MKNVIIYCRVSTNQQTYGNSLEYLSKLHLTFSQEFNIEDIAVILRALPNLNSMRLRKSGD